MRNTRIQFADRSECTGCLVCASRCVHQAITAVSDKNGYWFPKVDTARCVGCKACEKVCPILNRSVPKEPLCGYAAVSRDDEVRMRSSSGGIFLHIARAVVQNGGVVYGCAWDDIGEAKHVRIEQLEDLPRLCEAKYVQSETQHVYERVREDLLHNRQVLFSGTPCQVLALTRFLVHEYENLMLVDLICHGVPSREMFAALKRDVKRWHPGHGEVRRISFRDKFESWEARAVTTWFDDGAKIREVGFNNAYLLAFLNHYYIRPSCERCLANNGRSGSDLTLGDLWGISQIAPEFDDHKGASAVLVHTLRGKALIEDLDSISIRQVPVSLIIQNNASYSAVRKPERWRKVFLAIARRFGVKTAWGCVYYKRRLLQKVVSLICKR